MSGLVGGAAAAESPPLLAAASRCTDAAVGGNRASAAGVCKVSPVVGQLQDTSLHPLLDAAGTAAGCRPPLESCTTGSGGTFETPAPAIAPKAAAVAAPRSATMASTLKQMHDSQPFRMESQPQQQHHVSHPQQQLQLQTHVNVQGNVLSQRLPPPQAGTSLIQNSHLPQQQQQLLLQRQQHQQQWHQRTGPSKHQTLSHQPMHQQSTLQTTHQQNLPQQQMHQQLQKHHVLLPQKRQQQQQQQQLQNKSHLQVQAQTHQVHSPIAMHQLHHPQHQQLAQQALQRQRDHQQQQQQQALQQLQLYQQQAVLQLQQHIQPHQAGQQLPRAQVLPLQHSHSISQQENHQQYHHRHRQQLEQQQHETGKIQAPDVTESGVVGSIVGNVGDSVVDSGGGGSVGALSPLSQLSHLMTPRCTMSITRTKGLLNGPGQNNCFLNSAVQVLWHLDAFRRSLRDLVGHVCLGESCIFCALKELFGQFQCSEESALPADALRRALAETFFDQRRFQLGFMDDAAECFENMLLRIHYHLASHDLEASCSVAHCIPHQKFAMSLVEQTICDMCGAASDPLTFTQMVHYVSASALCAQAGSGGKHASEGPVSFGSLLYRAGGMGDIRDCPNSCGAKIQICRALTNKPDIVSLGLVWDSEKPTSEHIENVLNIIGKTLRMHEMFFTVEDQAWAQSTTHELVGIVTYYGKHYSTFFFHTKRRVWLFFDDATVREVGPRWEQVAERCHNNNFQPLLLLYANPDGRPVQTENAPKAVLRCPNAGLKHPSELSKFIGANSEVPPAMSHYANAQKWVQNSWQKTGEVPPNVVFKDFRPRTCSDSSVPGSLPVKSATIAKTFDHDPMNHEYINRQTVEHVLVKQRMQQRNQKAAAGGVQCQQGGVRTSSSSLESFENSLKERLLEQLQEGRRRDSGNWSGERNSSSSSSSTSLDNPYALPIIKRFQKQMMPLPSSPEYANEVAVLADRGYDTYSISSTDSGQCLPGSPHKALGGIREECLVHIDVAKMTHVSVEVVARARQDPYVNEIITQQGSMECEKLWAQSDWLIRNSYEKEQHGDLELAAFLSDCAAAKARVSMEAPYSNEQALIAARMKHSACVMRSNMIYKRIKEIELESKKRHKELEINHSRQGSRESRRSSSNHSRQNSRELLPPPPDSMLSDPIDSTIAIYATLPKRSVRKAQLDRRSASPSQDTPPRVPPKNFSVKEFLAADREQQRKTMSLTRSNSNPTGTTRSGDDEPLSETSAVSGAACSKDPKKVHKIRRKLIGGFMRRKNRSLPDLRDADDPGAVSAPEDCGSPAKAERTKAAQISPLRGFHPTTNRPYRPQLIKVTCPKITPSGPQADTASTEQSVRVAAAKDANTPPPEPPRKPNSDKQTYEDPEYAVPTETTAAPSAVVTTPAVTTVPTPVPVAAVTAVAATSVGGEERTEEQRAAFLSELQRKRAQMQQKKEQMMTSKSSLVDKDLPQTSQPQIQVQVPTLIAPHKIAGPDDSKIVPPPKVKSVKDLATKFESIVQVPAQKPGTGMGICSNVTSTADEVDCKVRPTAETAACLAASSNQNDFCFCSSNAMLPLLQIPASPGFTRSSSVRSTSSTGSGSSDGLRTRPPRPPDYETALQRRELMKRQRASISSSIDDELSNLPPPPTEILATPPLPRRSGSAINAESPTVSSVGQDACDGGPISLPGIISPGTCAIPKMPTALPNSKTYTGALNVHKGSSGFNKPPAPSPSEVAVSPPDFTDSAPKKGCLSADHTNGFPIEASVPLLPLGDWETPKARSVSTSSSGSAKKKSVTFSDQVELVSCAEEIVNDFVPNPVLKRVLKQHQVLAVQKLQNSTTESPDEAVRVATPELQVDGVPDAASVVSSSSPAAAITHMCNLCHSKSVPRDVTYCPDCAFYMSRFQKLE